MKKNTLIVFAVAVSAALTGCNDSEPEQKNEEPKNKYEEGFKMPGHKRKDDIPRHEVQKVKNTKPTPLTAEEEASLKPVSFEEATKLNPSYDSSSALYGEIGQNVIPLASLTIIKENSDSVEFELNAFDEDLAELKKGSVHIQVNKVILDVINFDSKSIKISKKNLGRMLLDPKLSDIVIYTTEKGALPSKLSAGPQGEPKLLDKLSGLSLDKYIDEARAIVEKEEAAKKKAEEEARANANDPDRE